MTFKAGDRVEYTGAYSCLSPNLRNRVGTVVGVWKTNVRVHFDGDASPDPGVFPKNLKLHVPASGIKVGDVVQLKSGGAPMTVATVGDEGYMEDTLRLVAASSGGLVQELLVNKAAVKLYPGVLTPALRQQAS